MKFYPQCLTWLALAFLLLEVAPFSPRPDPGIQKDPTYRIADIRVTGAKTLGRDRVIRVLGLKPGSKASEGDLERAVDALRREYFRYGFVKVEISLDKQTGPVVGKQIQLLSVSFDVKEGLHYF